MFYYILAFSESAVLSLLVYLLFTYLQYLLTAPIAGFSKEN